MRLLLFLPDRVLRRRHIMLRNGMRLALLLQIALVVYVTLVLDEVGIELFVVEKLGVEGERTLGYEGGEKDDSGEDGEVDTTNVEEGFPDVPAGDLLVDVTAEGGREDGVDRNL